MKTKMFAVILSLVVAMLLALPAPGTAEAVVVCIASDIEWDAGGAATLWNDALNWENDILPVAGETACIVGAAVTHSSLTHTIGALKTDTAFTLSGGRLNISGTSQIEGTFIFSGGTLGGAIKVGKLRFARPRSSSPGCRRHTHSVHGQGRSGRFRRRSSPCPSPSCPI